MNTFFSLFCFHIHAYWLLLKNFTFEDIFGIELFYKFTNTINSICPLKIHTGKFIQFEFIFVSVFTFKSV